MLDLHLEGSHVDVLVDLLFAGEADSLDEAPLAGTTFAVDIAAKVVGELDQRACAGIDIDALCPEDAGSLAGRDFFIGRRLDLPRRKFHVAIVLE